MRALTTGTPACAAISSRRDCSCVRHTISRRLPAEHPRGVGDRTPARRPGRAMPSMIIGKPPSSAIPEANDAWVRRVGLSKSTATVCGAGQRVLVVRAGLELQREVEHLGLLGRARGRRRAGSGASWLVPPAYAVSRMPGQASRNESACSRGEDQRRRQPDALGVGLFTMKPASRAAANTSAETASVRSRPDQQAGAAHLGDPVVPVQGRRAGARPISVGVLEQPVLLDGVEHREGGRRRDRVAAERGAVVAGLEQVGRLTGREARRRSGSRRRAPWPR